jgi:hypothetical protein
VATFGTNNRIQAHVADKKIVRQFSSSFVDHLFGFRFLHGIPLIQPKWILNIYFNAQIQ